jgi:hypothetical protein
MLEVLQNIIQILTTDPTLTAIVPAANIFTGPVDIVTEAEANLYYPQIQLSVVSETTRSVPTHARDSMIQVSIFSRNNQLETIQIYERVLTLLEYNSSIASGSTTIWWEKVAGVADQFESDRRIWHRAVTVVVWSQKPIIS